MGEETLLIVGNGFDLSMGFKTSYGDFMKSSFFPKYDFSQMGMDMGTATKRFLLYGLSYLAVILLVFFILYDIKTRIDKNPKM